MRRVFLKKLITLSILGCFLTPNVLTAFADPIQGGIHKDDNITNQENIFTGETHTVESRDEINMTVSQVLSGAYSQEGDEFFAEITQEVKGKKGVVLPVGTIAHGTIRQLEEAKRLGRDAWIEMEFDYLITPDGREIPIEAKMSSKANPIVGGSKAIAKNIGYTAAGGAVGGYAALQLLGIEGAIVSQGYTILGGAALGGAIALGMSLVRKGKDVLLSPGDEIKVKITSDIELPVISEEALRQEEIQLEGLTVRINNISLEKDPFGELNTYTLALSIINASKYTFSSFDVALMDEMNSIYYASIFSDTSFAFIQLKPGDRVAGSMSFSVTDKKRKHWLVFFDRRTRKPVAKISLDNASRDIEKYQKERKKKRKKRK